MHSEESQGTVLQATVMLDSKGKGGGIEPVSVEVGDKFISQNTEAPK